MIATALCVAALVTTYLATRRGLVAGLSSLLGWGYLFGILRANALGAGSYFIFDSAVVGFYAAAFTSPNLRARLRRVPGDLAVWVKVLSVWACLLFFVPFQDYLIQLVGLRGNVFFVPFLLVGFALAHDERQSLGLALAVLNVVALGFALAEYIKGVPEFFPLSPATQIIYMSNDIAVSTGFVPGTTFRIPATFSNAHSYGGTMVMTLPWILSAWMGMRTGRLRRTILILGMFGAVTGVFLSATRQNFILMALVMLVVFFSVRLRVSRRVTLIIVLVIVGYLVAQNERLQRFTSLGEEGAISERILGSVNMGFFEVISDYPMGNGMGGGGTSIPYFLQSRLLRPVAIENEYARIALEQGIPGLFLWVAFIFWLVFRKTKTLGERIAHVLVFASFGIGLIGTGLMASVPGTLLLMLAGGWIVAGSAARSRIEVARPSIVRTARATG